MTIMTVNVEPKNKTPYESMGLAEAATYYTHERQSVFVTARNRRKAMPTAIYERLERAKAGGLR